TYWAIALMTNSASGEDSSKNRPTGPGARRVVALLKQFGVRALDLLPQWLEAEPAGERERRVVARVRRVLVGDQVRGADRLGGQLGLATALHRDEPEGGFFDGLADGEQAVVLVDRGLAGRERGGE